jgi:UPF0716 protein FxsA
MLLGLFLLFTLVPLVELYLLIRLGTYIGAVDTIAIVIGTGLAGGLLAKSQGLAVLDRMRMELNQGRPPAESLFDGMLIFIAGAMLITPGLLTDGLGLLLLIPWSRQVFKSWLKRKIQEKISEREIHISTHLH